MAKRQQKVVHKIPDDVNMSSDSTLEIMEEGMKAYGEYVLENRAIPDYRDGLKPVQRRILWAMHNLNLHGNRGITRKSAKIVGDTTGSYHPHGDTAVYQSLVTMAHSAQAPVVGQGNFGNIAGDPPAAQRYTEARLSKYSDKTFFNAKFIPVIDKAENYDGSAQEPIVLPSSVPNLLLNGAFGIGVAATCSIPAFEPNGVGRLASRAIREQTVTLKDCMKYLVPTCAEGAIVDVDDPINKEGLKNFFETGEGRIKWEPAGEADLTERTLIISGFVPRATKLSLETSLKKVYNDPTVQSCIDVSDIGLGIAYKINFKSDRSLAAIRVQEAVDKVCGYFTTTQSLVFTATKRFKPTEDSVEVPVEFAYINMTKFFNMWSKWRTALERKAILHQQDVVLSRLARDELMLKAAMNRDAIRQSWEAKEPVRYLMRAMKITEDEAKIIRELRIRQLDSLEEKALRVRIKESKEQLQVLKQEYKEPADRILSDIKEILK